MNSEPEPQTPFVYPTNQQHGISKKMIALLGCGVLFGFCVILGVAGSFLFVRFDSSDDGGVVVTIPAGKAPASATLADNEHRETTAPTTTNAVTTPTSATPSTETADATATTIAVATTTPDLLPTSVAIGAGPSNPVPFGDIATVGDWEVRIVEVVRGKDAYKRLLEANQFNTPAPPGMEYVLVNVWVKYTGTESEAQTVDFSWFNATGEARVRWSWATVVDPAPELTADLFSGDEASGWTTVLAQQEESNLILIVEPVFSVGEGGEAFLALEPGAAVTPITKRLAEPNDFGFDPASPVPLGEPIVGETWEIRVIESIRGDEALARVKEANRFNDDPAPGMEYVLVHIGVRNVNPATGSQHIDKYSFQMTGDSGNVYDQPGVVDPVPALNADVYAGGDVDGWITLQVSVDEQNIKLVYEPAFSFTAQPRYLAID